MKGIFSLDSKPMQVLSRFGDILLLNVVYLLTCIPLVTIGAATNALYSVCFKMGTDEEDGLYKRYFHVFAADFKQATIVWLLYFAVGFSSLYYCLWFLSMSGWMHALFIPAIAVFVLVSMTAAMAFPLMSQFRDRTITMLRNAFLLCLGYLPRALLAAILNLLPVGMFFLDPYHFFQAGVLWFTVYFSAAAYLNSRLLRPVFDRIRSNSQTPSGEEISEV